MFSSKTYKHYINKDVEMIQQGILLEYAALVKTKFECIRCCDSSYMEYIANTLSEIFVDSTIRIEEMESVDENGYIKTFYKLTVDWTI
jgi:hypothetical protein